MLSVIYKKKSGKVWNRSHFFLERSWKRVCKKGKKKKYRRTNSRQFDRIFIDTPVSPPVFRPVDTRRRNPEAENSPRFRGRIPRPASRGFWVQCGPRD